ncbi:hypothetical protein [Spirilliplanes yamanashiensis]|uniref:Lipoprotein n=1 Tax=Spirilliplanes yamanashiensis TaxID=42233 RepID=A0A8J3Y499_9ACTN|nr:hypothetical protein [Spirilliplanes yamanashiensis]MDP9820059.1 hypothetical protein [Spirilliplanes yamanashiensis]GIJ01120.1 hypothetical protein Sya03_04720 [Spirilliplanes yamanashiensis]
MLDRRLTGTGLGLLTAVAFGVAGCSGDATPPGASPSVSVSPSPGASSGAPADPAAAAALGDAAAKLGTTPFKVTVTSGPALTITSRVDAPGGVGTSNARYTAGGADITVEALLADQDLYVKVPGVTEAGKWVHVDVARLPEGANVGLVPGRIDPTNTAELLSSTTDVRSTGPGSYAGTLDLTKAAGVAGVDKVMIDGYGQAASAIPFRAGVDDQGRLSELTLDLPALNGRPVQPLEVLYTDYGTPVTAAKPTAAEIVEAPESLYKTLGG